MNAFNDFMRDFDNLIGTALGKPPAPGYLTDIADAHLLLTDDSESFPWFANRIEFYRNYYRDEATPPAGFGLLLSVPGYGQLNAVQKRWNDAGVQVASVTR